MSRTEIPEIATVKYVEKSTWILKKRVGTGYYG
jgi:hypothetical protein